MPEIERQKADLEVLTTGSGVAYVKVDDLIKYLIGNSLISTKEDRKQTFIDLAGELSKLLDNDI